MPMPPILPISSLSAGAIVLVAVAVNVDAGGRPIQYAETRFAADRVELSVSTEA